MEVGSSLQGISLYIAEMNSITFFFVATRTNLFHKQSQIPAKGVLESIVSESVPLDTPNSLVYITIGKGRSFRCNT